MKEFFMYETEIEYGQGFSHFGILHCIWLLGLLLGGWILTHWFKKNNIQIQRKALHVLGTLLPLMELYRDGVLIATGHFDYGFLPCHMCSLALLFGFLSVWTGYRPFQVIYLSVGMPGALAALLFPNWDGYPFFNYMHIHAFVSHGCILLLGVWMLVAGVPCPGWREFWIPVFFGLMGFCLIPILNTWLDTNFWFLNIPSHDSPLVWIYQWAGNDGYPFFYYMFCMVVIGIWQEILIVLTTRGRA